MNNFLSLTNFYKTRKLITNNQIKFVRSLHFKKNRDVHNCFIVEGEKMVDELLKSEFKVQSVFATKDWKNPAIDNEKVQYISEKQLERISALKSPNKLIAVVEKSNDNFEISSIHKGLTLVLDDISNPGNLGTIIRLCDWFGIRNIICSRNSVELYNPKVIQATMGSFLRANVYYTDIVGLIKQMPSNFPIYGSFMEGENIKNVDLEENALLIMGNESIGISEKLQQLVSKRIAIKSDKSKAESLNVAIAAAILLYEFKQ